MPLLIHEAAGSTAIFAGLALWMIGAAFCAATSRLPYPRRRHLRRAEITVPSTRASYLAMSAAITLIWSVAAFPEANAADTCAPIGYTCQGGAETRIVDGFEYTPSSCWNRSVLLNCERNPPYDSCTALEAAPTCVELSTTCVETREGECTRSEKRFSCQNATVDESELTIIDASYTITRDEVVDQCGPLEAEQNCVYQGQVCSEGPETRMINGLAVTKECWAWEKTYSCPAETETSDCGEIEADASCEQVGETCLNERPDGSCAHRETNYKCGGAPGGIDPTGGDPSCGAVEVCVGGDCRSYEDEPNKDFGKAAAYLNMLDAIAKDFEDFEIFTGEDQRCRKWPLGLLNCCSDSGLILDVLNVCNETEHRLRDAVNAETTHYVGTYCSEKALFVCLEKKRVYCTFNNEFGRIVHEDGREQLGIPWRLGGEVKQPNCRGLTPEEIEAIDFEQVDLSPLYDDMISKTQVPDYNALSSRLQDDINDFTEGGIRPDPDGDDVEVAGGEIAEFDYDRRTRQCFAGEAGEITEERKVAVGPFGSRTPLEDWIVVANTCAIIQIESRQLSCAAPWLGQTTEERRFVERAEGGIEYLSPWEQTANGCYQDDLETRTRQCEPPRQGALDEVRDVRVFQAGPDQVLSEWRETGGGCFTLETESRPASCPATFAGSRTEERTFRLWDDGSMTNYSSWVLASDDCFKRQTETRAASCAAGWSGSRTESRDYDLLPDGSRVNYSAWAETANACYILRTQTRNIACQSGYSGTHGQRRTYRDNQIGAHSHYSAWTTTTITCSRSGYDTRNASCAAPWTAGALAQRRNWTQLQGASKVYTSSWYTVANSCNREIYVYRDVSCPGGDGGFMRQRQLQRDYADGRPNVALSSWVTVSSNCGPGN